MGKIEDQLFMSNPATVVQWRKSLEKSMRNFDFGKVCQRKSRSSRAIFCPVF